MKEEHEIVRLVRAAQDSADEADSLIRQYTPFIKAETAKVTKRIPQESDDALSIAMFAFYEAAMAYQSGRGAFLPLAASAIRNRLIDYHRREQRHAGAVSLDAPASDGEDERTLLEQVDAGRDEIGELTERSAAKAEIQHFARDLAAFGLSLTDVAESCPRQERTLEACRRVLAYARENPLLLEEMTQSKRLPLAQLAAGAGVERKTLERHRKYLVAILLAYTNGFEMIREHLRQLKGKGGQRA